MRTFATSRMSGFSTIIRMSSTAKPLRSVFVYAMPARATVAMTKRMEPPKRLAIGGGADGRTAVDERRRFLEVMGANAIVLRRYANEPGPSRRNDTPIGTGSCYCWTRRRMSEYLSTCCAAK